MLKEHVISSTSDYRLVLKYAKCYKPTDLYQLEFVQESLKDGKVTRSSKFDMFLPIEALESLGEVLSTKVGLEKSFWTTFGAA